MFERLEFYEMQRKPLEVRFKASARESEDVKLLMSIPGAGHYLASFFGVVPTQRNPSSIKLRGNTG